ncbi:MAG: hypothetical protein AAF985_05335, partial [Bacteroidota bacterium]
MPYPLSVPFFAFKLRFLSGGTLLSPLSDAQALRINEPLEIVAGKYAELFQRKVLDKGNIQQILDEYAIGDFYKSTLNVAFDRSKDGISYPDFDL